MVNLFFYLMFNKVTCKHEPADTTVHMFSTSSLVALHVEPFDVLWFLKVFFKRALKILTYLHRSTSPQRGLSL